MSFVAARQITTTNALKMSTEILTTEDGQTQTNFEEFSTPSTAWYSDDVTAASFDEDFSTTESVNNTLGDKQEISNESQVMSQVFEAFIVIEIVMTALELILSILAATKIARWRRNYRNQMLMQLSLVRFIKRIISLVEFCRNTGQISSSEALTTMLISAHIYLDFVIVILIFFFIKHMYDSLIVVLVKISQNNLVKVLACGWLLPVPISALGTALIVNHIVGKWLVYLLICCVFRWPLMFLGTLLYVTILFRVFKDSIRQFASSLAVTTFLLCLVLNLYMFSRDIIFLWCFHSFTTKLVSYVLGFVLNLLILSLYIILILLNVKCQSKSKNTLHNHSLEV